MRIRYIFLFSIIFILFNCSEQENPNDKITLDLISPHNDAEVGHCCLAFNWKPINSEREYRFQLSTQKTFDTILIDKLVATDSLFIDYLDPSLTYYWKVTSATHQFTSGISSFTGIPYGQFYTGDYNGTRTEYGVHWEENLVVDVDTTYSTTISIQSTTDGKFIIDNTVFEYEPSFVENIINLGLPTNYNSNGKTAIINLDAKSIVYTTGHYGGGGSYTSTITALLE